MMMSLDEAYRLELGHNLGSIFSVIEDKNRTGLLMSCTFKGRNCTDPRLVVGGLIFRLFIARMFRNWYSFSHPKYGNCFTFNSRLSPSVPVRQVTLTGSDHGLVLELFLDQTNYMYNKLTKSAGARITVHDP